MDKVNPRKIFSCRSISSVINSDGKLFQYLLELHLDQWNAGHVNLSPSVGFDNYTFLFFSAFRRATIHDERLS